MSDNGGEFGSFLAGFVIGGLVGAAAALVLAPQSGAETRSQLTGRGREFVDASEERYHHAVDTVDAYAQQASERAQQFGQDVERQARIILDAGRQESPNSGEGGSAESVAADDEILE